MMGASLMISGRVPNTHKTLGLPARRWQETAPAPVGGNEGGSGRRLAIYLLSKHLPESGRPPDMGKTLTIVQELSH